MLRPARRLLFVPALVFAGCAPTTRPPQIAPELIAEEERIQRELVIRENLAQQHRLDSVAYPILNAAVPLCEGRTGALSGFRFTNIHNFSGVWREAARSALGLDDTLTVTVVTPGTPAEAAGLRVGDRIVGVSGGPAPTGPNAGRDFGEVATEALEAGSLRLELLRDGTVRHATVTGEPGCAFDLAVVPSLQINALADGARIYVTSGLLHFADDDELAAVVAHEFAHNAMGHLDAVMRNMLIGGIFGLIGDIATLAAGDTLPDESHTSYLARLGARAFSRAFEREADYVGLYALALAGMPTDGAVRIWRKIAVADPESIGVAHTHPTHAERFILMQRTLAEIREKLLAGEALVPETKGRQGGGP